jgi:5'-nucleotidase
LISNDDGIWAPGLLSLARAIAEIADKLWICAPDRERSAISHALTMGLPLRAEKTAFRGIEAEAWSVSGTPSDCVKLALEELLPERPDIVLSGINRGPNLGTDVIYSGTVAAAAEGAFAGIPAIAVSTGSYDPSDYEPAARVAAKLASQVATRGLPDGVVLNVNVPDGFNSGKVAVTRLGVQRYNNIFERRVDPRGRPYYWLSGDPDTPPSDDGLDTEAIRTGAVSITPLRFDATCRRTADMLKEWDIRL